MADPEQTGRGRSLPTISDMLEIFFLYFDQRNNGIAYFKTPKMGKNAEGREN